jgi:hypothetical protein
MQIVLYVSTLGSQTKSLIFLTTAGISRPGLEPGAFATRERSEH